MKLVEHIIFKYNVERSQVPKTHILWLYLLVYEVSKTGKSVDRT